MVLQVLIRMVLVDLEHVRLLDLILRGNMVWRILEDPKALNKRLYKEVTEASLTAVLIIAVRNSLGWEVNTIAPVET